MSIYAKLNIIQTKLKAPKNQFNSFGKYKYRSCEDILEGVKPLLEETQTVLTICDNIINVADRFYIQAVATLTDEKGNTIETSAIAREPLNKKGMDEPQITGTASSYARKYALNGLFAIDDTKDSDTDESKKELEVKKKKEEEQKKKEKEMKEKKELEAKLKRADKVNKIIELAKSKGVEVDMIKSIMKTKFKKESTKDLTEQEIDILEKDIKEV